MKSKPRLWAIVPAAGSGSRMGTVQPKQFLRLGDRTVLEHSLEALWSVPNLAGIVLVNDDAMVQRKIRERFSPRMMLAAAGGEHRCNSVVNGLTVLAEQAHADDWVLVHDAARPCVRSEDLRNLVNTVTASGDGGLLAVRVCDTIKRTGTDQFVNTTIDRECLWQAQTPQMFRVGELLAAKQAAIADGYAVTDSASAMEHAGYQPRLVEGHTDNIKITRPEDLALAEWYLKQQGRL